MAGACIIGNRYANPKKVDEADAGASTLPAEPRSLHRLLKLLRDPDQAASVLTQCAAHQKLRLDLSRLRYQRNKRNSKKQEEGSSRYYWVVENPEMEMAKLTQRTFENLKKKKAAAISKSMQSVISLQTKRGIPKPDVDYDDDDDDDDDDLEDMQLMPPPTRTTRIMSDVESPLVTATAPLVSSSSDSEGVLEEEEGKPSAQHQVVVEQELAVMDFWPHLLEHVHLHVTSRTICTWGRKKVYEVYRLAGPTMPVLASNDGVEAIRAAVQKEFLAFYDGTTGSSKFDLRYSECRVYAAMQEVDSRDGDTNSNNKILWIQINVGRSLDTTDEMQRSKTGNKKQKAGNEFVAVIPQESNLVALTASRSPSRSRFTPYVLSALETALTCSVVGGYGAKDAYSQRLEDLSGTDPHELLRSAQAVEERNAVGRFASYARAGKAADPMTELHSAATGSFLERKEHEQQRLELGQKHGRQLARRSAQIAVASHGRAALLASNLSGTSSLIDQSVQESQNRKRARDEELGGDGDLPVRTCVRWDWKGETTAAAAACWGDHHRRQGDDDDDDDKEEMELPTHKFKCRVVMQGPDVFAGLRALMAAGIMRGPLPHYIKDAASMGGGGTIVVDHGAVRTRVDTPKVK